MLQPYIYISLADLEVLQKEQRALQALYYAPNSILARRTQVKKYLHFEVSFLFSPFPCTDEHIALYMTWLARKSKCFGSQLLECTDEQVAPYMTWLARKSKCFGSQLLEWPKSFLVGEWGEAYLL